MTDSSDLSSTEKLLDTIRGDAGSPAVPETRPSGPVGGGSIRTQIKGLCAGVHIGNSSLSLVLTGEPKPGGTKEIVKWEVIPFPDHLDLKSRRFPAFLGTSLSSFLGRKKNIALWASISTNQLKLRNLIIPNVPDSKMANAALWGLKKEIEVDPAAETFDYEFIGDTRVNGIKKKNIVAFTGDKKNIAQVKDLFSSAGYPLTGITATPFAIQNYLLTGLVRPGQDPLVIVNVRRYRSEIFGLSENGIMVARSIKTGSYSLVENYLESDAAKGDNADVPTLLAARTATGSPDFAPMEGPASRLIGKIQRTGEYCSHMYMSNTPISKYYFFGETDNCRAFNDFAREMIPDRVLPFSPDTDMAGIGVNLPKEGEARNGIIPALGLALSGNEYTPNFLYTYLEKEIENRARKLNKGIVAAGLAGLMICAGTWFYFNQQENKEIKSQAAIERELAVFDKSVTQDILNKRIQDAQKQMDMIRMYADNYLSLAVISEICSLTPETISIVSLDARLNGKKEKEKSGKKEDKKESAKRLKLQGIVKADFTSLESTLTGFVFRLGDSPIFGKIELKDKKVEQTGETSILKFTADMEIR